MKNSIFALLVVAILIGCSAQEEKTQVEENIDPCGDGVCEYGENTKCPEDCSSGIGGNASFAVTNLTIFTDGTLVVQLQSMLEDPVILKWVGADQGMRGIRNIIIPGEVTEPIIVHKWTSTGEEGQLTVGKLNIIFSPALKAEPDTREFLSVSRNRVGITPVSERLQADVEKLRALEYSDEEIIKRLQYEDQEELLNVLSYPFHD